MTLVLTGLDVEAKARARDDAALSGLLGGARAVRDRSTSSWSAPTTPTPPTNPEATALLRVTVMDPDKEQGRPAVLERGHRARPRELRGLLHDDAADGRLGLRRVLAAARAARRGATTPSSCPTATRVEIPHARVASGPLDAARRAARARRASGRRRAGRSATCAARARATRAATRTSGCGRATDDAYHWLDGDAHRRAVQSAADRGRGARGAPLRAGEPARAQLRRGGPPRRRRRVVDALRPPGQGARRVPALARSSTCPTPLVPRAERSGRSARDPESTCARPLPYHEGMRRASCACSRPPSRPLRSLAAPSVAGAAKTDCTARLEPGVNLRGCDLSHRQLQHVNLTGANLAGREPHRRLAVQRGALRREPRPARTSPARTSRPPTSPTRRSNHAKIGARPSSRPTSSSTSLVGVDLGPRARSAHVAARSATSSSAGSSSAPA